MGRAGEGDKVFLGSCGCRTRCMSQSPTPSLTPACQAAQVQLLDAVYAGDAANRCPYVLLVASALAPKPPRAAALLRSAGLTALPGAAQELAQARF